MTSLSAGAAKVTALYIPQAATLLKGKTFAVTIKVKPSESFAVRLVGVHAAIYTVAIGGSLANRPRDSLNCLNSSKLAST